MYTFWIIVKKMASHLLSLLNHKVSLISRKCCNNQNNPTCFLLSKSCKLLWVGTVLSNQSVQTRASPALVFQHCSGHYKLLYSSTLEGCFIRKNYAKPNIMVLCFHISVCTSCTVHVLNSTWFYVVFGLYTFVSYFIIRVSKITTVCIRMRMNWLLN